jgi:hypothetical protein
MQSRKLFSVGFVSVLVVLSAVSVGGLAGTGAGPATLAQSDTGDEPNDSRENATAIEKRTNVEGSVNGSDIDFLSFEASVGQIIRVTDGFAAGGGGANVMLLTPDGETLGSGTAGASTAGTAEIGAKAPTDGTYYLRVGSVPGGTSYSLSVATTDRDAFEPNDDRANATSISAGESVDGTVVNGTNLAEDRDWFAVDVQASQTLTATLEKTDAGLNFGSPETGQNLRVDVVGPDSDRLDSNATVADSGNTLGTVTAQVSADEGGTYYVRVGSVDGTSGVVGFVGYSLTAETPTAAETPTETETPDETEMETSTETTTEETTESKTGGFELVGVTVDQNEVGPDSVNVNLKVVDAPLVVGSQSTAYYNGEILTNISGQTYNESISVTIGGPINGDSVRETGNNITIVNASDQIELVNITSGPSKDPNASVTFNNQTTDGTTVMVESVTLSDSGFVAIHNASLLNGDEYGSVVGVSEPLSAGTHEDVEVTLFDVPGQSFAKGTTLEESQTLIAMPHLDNNRNDVYDFITSNGVNDSPYTEAGSAVVDTASVTVADETDAQAAYYQVDLVVGEPIENLRGPEGTYTNDQLIRFAHGSAEEPITRRSDGEFITDDAMADRIESQNIEVANGTATTTFTVAEGESITLTLASYEKVGPGWSPQTESEQVFVDSETRTFESGTHTLTVDLPDEDLTGDSDDADAE